MSTVITTNIIDRIIAAPTVLNGATVGVVLMREAPVFTNQDSRYLGVTTLASLLALPGWLAGTTLADTEAASLRSEGNNRYALWNEVEFTGALKQEAKAAVIYYVGTLNSVVNPIIAITNDPFGGEKVVVTEQDGLTSNPDLTLVGSNRYFMSWAVSGATPVASSFTAGPLALSKGPPEYESSHAQHVWLFPQRANMMANPSFEKVGTDFWSGNGAITRVAEPAPGGNSAWAGRFAASGGYAIAESNVFPTMREELWTIQLMVKGTGTLKVGFVWWNDDFADTSVDWGTDSWTLSPDTYTRITTLRNPVDTYQGMLRLELQGAGPLTIDDVCVEKGAVKDWPYFDGSTTFGARGDYSWYGGESRQGATYSLWYNNRRAVYGRLFARDITDDTLVTDEVMARQGFVYQWVPAGTVVIPHIDVLYEEDLQATVPPKAAGVLGYKANPYELTKVQSPWS